MPTDLSGGIFRFCVCEFVCVSVLINVKGGLCVGESVCLCLCQQERRRVRCTSYHVRTVGDGGTMMLLVVVLGLMVLTVVRDVCLFKVHSGSTNRCVGRVLRRVVVCFAADD